MSYLFEISGLRVQPSTEVLLLHPFTEIWERDKSKAKSAAIKEFTYIEFMSSMKATNPYAGYAAEERHSKLSQDLFAKRDYKPDKLVMEGVQYLTTLQTEGSPTYQYYTAALEAAAKMRTFFNTFNLLERTEKGMPLYKPGDITKALNDTEKVLSNLSTMKEKLEQELFQMTRTRASKVINPFER